jgi:hypothetical protein
MPGIGAGFPGMDRQTFVVEMLLVFFPLEVAEIIVSNAREPLILTLPPSPCQFCFRKWDTPERMAELSDDHKSLELEKLPSRQPTQETECRYKTPLIPGVWWEKFMNFFHRRLDGEVTERKEHALIVELLLKSDVVTLMVRVVRDTDNVVVVFEQLQNSDGSISACYDYYSAWDLLRRYVEEGKDGTEGKEEKEFPQQSRICCLQSSSPGLGDILQTTKNCQELFRHIRPHILLMALWQLRNAVQSLKHPEQIYNDADVKAVFEYVTQFLDSPNSFGDHAWTIVDCISSFTVLHSEIYDRFSKLMIDILKGGFLLSRKRSVLVTMNNLTSSGYFVQHSDLPTVMNDLKKTKLYLWDEVKIILDTYPK